MRRAKQKLPEWRERIAEVSPEALCADGFDDAFIGFVEKWDVDGVRRDVVVYDRDKCIEIL
jgi:hypothetical protein